MLCEACQKNPASVHLTDVSNNSKQELHLCDECAKRQGVTIKSYMNKESSYPELLPQIVESQIDESSEPGDRDLTCPRCGMTYRKFRSTGKFGCPHDYVVFKKGLVGLLEKIHGKSHHSGKVPARASDEIARQQEVRSLRTDLEAAVRSEDYEAAANLRDKIYQIEGRDA